MPDAGVESILIICEADADRRTACTLVDRLICREVDWITPELLDAFRTWRGLSGADKFLDLHLVWQLARESGAKIKGFFDGEPGATDARSARLALLLLAESKLRPSAVAVMRDTDNDPERRKGWEQARKYKQWPFPIVLGLAHTKRECWFLAGFEPTTKEEIVKFATMRLSSEPGFDPCTESHRLTAKHDADKNSAKRVLKELVADERKCWENCDLKLLVERGSQNGLADFINEIQSNLIPLFDPARKPR